jgi:hypothetical protein
MLRPAPLERMEGLQEPALSPESSGLTTAQVEERTARYGPNLVLEAPPST